MIEHELAAACSNVYTQGPSQCETDQGGKRKVWPSLVLPGPSDSRGEPQEEYFK